MRKGIGLVLFVCCLAGSGMAEERFDYLNMRHEVRIGWGDQLFESLIWHNPTNIYTTLPADFQKTYSENYHHNQHIWLEYQYRVKEWFSVGAMMDVSSVGWDEVKRNGAGTELARDKGHYFYNLAFMPTIRFTYFFHPNVNLYSGLGFGMDINGGTETNSSGHKTDVGAAVNITVLGVSANYERWFFSFDLGGLTALKNANTIFMMSSRMLNVGIGARF